MEGRAQRIEFDGRMDKVQLYTRASVKRGEDIVHGDYISYDANAEYAEVLGGVKSESGGSSSGRVKAIIQPKNKQLLPKPQAPSSQAPKPQAPSSEAPTNAAPLAATPAVSKTLRLSNKLE